VMAKKVVLHDEINVYSIFGILNAVIAEVD
jgi:hypothetical protein